MVFISAVCSAIDSILVFYFDYFLQILGDAIGSDCSNLSDNAIFMHYPIAHCFRYHNRIDPKCT